MGMTVDQLVAKKVDHIRDIVFAFFLTDLGIEKHMQEHITEFL